MPKAGRHYNRELQQLVLGPVQNNGHRFSSRPKREALRWQWLYPKTLKRGLAAPSAETHCKAFSILTGPSFHRPYHAIYLPRRSLSSLWPVGIDIGLRAVSPSPSHKGVPFFSMHRLPLSKAATIFQRRPHNAAEELAYVTCPRGGNYLPAARHQGQTPAHPPPWPGG